MSPDKNGVGTYIAVLRLEKSSMVDNNARYWAYSNYLIALSRLLSQEYPTDCTLAIVIANSGGFKRLRRATPSIDQSALSKALRQGWFTEILLWKKAQYPDLLPFAVPWSMVESYYAVYAIVKAYFLVSGRNEIGTHEGTLRTICSDVTNCKDRFPRPWNCVLNGDPKTSPVFVTNVQQPVLLTNPLVSPYRGDLWQHYGLFLKTTRQRQIDRLIQRWKKNNRRKRIPKGERQRIVQGWRPTTVFDTLYRIRSRSNYQDIDSFAFCNATTLDFTELQVAIWTVVYKTMFVFEMLIARLIRKKDFGSLVHSFVSTNLGQASKSTITKRWDCIRQSF